MDTAQNHFVEFFFLLGFDPDFLENTFHFIQDITQKHFRAGSFFFNKIDGIIVVFYGFEKVGQFAVY